MFKKRRLELAGALLESLTFMHSQGWLHNDLHARNILLHFPAWSYSNEGKKVLGHTSDLVFIGITDLGLAQHVADAQSPHSFKYPPKEQHPGVHVAPELHEGRGDLYNIKNKGPQNFTKFTDVYSLGIQIRRMCFNFYDEQYQVGGKEWRETLPGGPDAFGKLKSECQRLCWRMTRGMNNPDAPADRRTARENRDDWREILCVDSIESFRPMETMTPI